MKTIIIATILILISGSAIRPDASTQFLAPSFNVSLPAAEQVRMPWVNENDPQIDQQMPLTQFELQHPRSTIGGDGDREREFGD